MANCEGICPECEQNISYDVGQSFNGNLSWYRSIRCKYCGAVIEEDDYGYPPLDVRKAIILDEGEWCLSVESDKKKSSQILKVLRKALDLNLKDAAKLSKDIPGIIHRGTKTEMEWLQQKLADAGIKTSVFPDQ